MSHDWRLRLDDLIESAEKIGRLVDGKDLETFQLNEAIFDAVLFNLQVIGESVKGIPAEIKAEIPGRDWSLPARLRDLIAHHYFDLDAGLIWHTASVEIPKILVDAKILKEKYQA
ncbi:MAG: DUF86 domain-containing protein [Spirochaetes bacterium]|nr:DUF86 domain-containing protein [Spirochaetota bacterium]